MTSEVSEVLGIGYKAYENQKKEIDLLRAHLYNCCADIKRLKDVVEGYRLRIEDNENATLWQRIKYLFFKKDLSHQYITQKAIEIGYYPKDIFILLAKNRLVANWQKNQKHARKYHCYFLVFQKSKVKVNYEET